MGLPIVLILVLVEHTLRGAKALNRTCWERLNPCFSGTYSQSICAVIHWRSLAVLILVLVEHTLRD